MIFYISIESAQDPLEAYCTATDHIRVPYIMSVHGFECTTKETYTNGHSWLQADSLLKSVLSKYRLPAVSYLFHIGNVRMLQKSIQIVTIKGACIEAQGE